MWKPNTILSRSNTPIYLAMQLRGLSAYSVDNEAVLKSLRPGDDIRAVVYPNENTLHNIRVVYRRHAK